jgi:hypothetical protein
MTVEGRSFNLRQYVKASKGFTGSRQLKVETALHWIFNRRSAFGFLERVLKMVEQATSLSRAATCRPIPGGLVARRNGQGCPFHPF